MKIKIAIHTLLLILVCQVSAADITWIGGDGGGVSDPTIGANWTGGTVPGAGDMARIDPTLTAYTAGTNDPIFNTAYGTVDELGVDNGGKVYFVTGGSLTVDENDVNILNGSLLDISGGTLTIGTGTEKGLKIKFSSTFVFTGGTVNCYKDFIVEEGTVCNMSGAATSLVVDFDGNGSGKFKVKGKSGLPATFNMSNGTVTVGTNGVEMDGNAEGPATIASLNISGGNFINNGYTRFKKSVTDSTLIKVTGGTVLFAGDIFDDVSNEGKINFEISGGTLEFGGAITLDAEDIISQSGTGVITFSGTNTIPNAGTITSSGTVIFDGATTLYGAGTYQFFNVQINDNSTLEQDAANINIAGDWTNNEAAASAGFIPNTNTITFNGSATQLITQAGGTETFYHLVINTTGGDCDMNGSTNLDIDGNLTIADGSELDCENNNITLFGNWINNDVDASDGFTPGTGTVTFNGTDGQTIDQAGSTETFYNIIVNTTGGDCDINGSTNLDIDGNLTIADGSDLDSENNDITISGDWINNDTDVGDGFTEGTGTVTFDGADEQNLTHAGGEEQFYNVTISKSAEGLILDDKMTINSGGTLTFTQGLVSSSIGNEVVFNNGALTNGGDSDSYVDGPVIKKGTDAFVFPLGDGLNWARLGISARDDAADQFTAQYTKGDYGDSTVAFPLNNVSSIEYWDLNEDNDAGAANSINITLYWESSTGSGIDDYSADLVVGHYNGSGDWVDAGQIAITGASPGNVTSDAITSFSPFTFASKSDATNPLPIELISFDAIIRGSEIELIWTTASEINNNFFTVLRSNDADYWEDIGHIQGMGNSQVLTEYRFRDRNPIEGLSYYKLKQTDFDGKSEEFNIVAIEYADKTSPSPIIFPNPVDRNSMLYITVPSISTAPVFITLYSSYGEVILEKSIPEKLTDSTIEMNLDGNFNSGIYFLKVHNTLNSHISQIVIR